MQVCPRTYFSICSAVFLVIAGPSELVTIVANLLLFVDIAIGARSVHCISYSKLMTVYCQFIQADPTSFSTHSQSKALLHHVIEILQRMVVLFFVPRCYASPKFETSRGR